MTLTGTNTYLVGAAPCWVIDPGPDDERHIAAVRDAAESRGGIGGVVLTHSHADHSAGVAALGEPLAWGTSDATLETDWARSATATALATRLLTTPAGRRIRIRPPGPQSKAEGLPGPTRKPTRAPATPPADDAPGAAADWTGPPAERIGPFTVIPTPGHAADHVCFLWERVLFCGDLVLGEGSTIVPPKAFGGSLADYMASLERIAALDLELMAPGHGPWITEPEAKVAEYLGHRREREAKLRAAIEAGERSRERLLDAAWGDVPQVLRPAAALALQAHVEKLEHDGVLTPDTTEP